MEATAHPALSSHSTHPKPSPLGRARGPKALHDLGGSPLHSMASLQLARSQRSKMGESETREPRHGFLVALPSSCEW